MKSRGAIDRYLQTTRNQSIEPVSSQKVVRRARVEEIALPEKPPNKVRLRGFLGLGGEDPQDLSHDVRLQEENYLGIEVSYAELMALGIEMKGIKATRDAMKLAEAIVDELPEDSVAAMVAADFAADIAVRARRRHGLLMDAYDAEILNILQRR